MYVLLIYHVIQIGIYIYNYTGDFKRTLVIKNYTFTFTPYSITVLFAVMNIPIIFGGLYELSVIECKPYSHFFILCDSFTTFISTVNIPIEKYL